MVDNPGLPIKKVTWSKVESLCESIAKWTTLLKAPPIRIITTVPRGGLVPAALLAHLLDIPDIRPNVLHLVLDNPDNLLDKSVLWVDDIFDSGKTLRKSKEILGDLEKRGVRVAYVALLSKLSMQTLEKHGAWAPDFIDKNVWVQYPWEVKA